MKRKITLGSIILIIVAMSYGFIASKEVSTFGLNEIVIESFDDSESSFNISKEDELDFNYFIGLINDSEKFAIDNSNIEPSHQVKFKTNTKEKTYLFDVDVLTESVSIYDLEEEHSYSVEPNTYVDIMLHPAFSSAYINSMPPKIIIGDGQTPVEINESMFDWNYKKIDDQWYESDTPTVEVETTEPFVINKHSQKISVSFNIVPDILTYQIFDNEELVHEQPLSEESILPYKDDGKKTFVIEAKWSESNDQDFYGNATYKFEVNTDLPATLTFNESNVEIGGVFKIIANNLNPDEKPFLSQKIRGSFQFYNIKGETLGYLPASYHTKAGSYPLEFWTETEEGIKSDPIEYVLDVDSRDFKIQQLTISTSIVKATRNDEAYSQFAKYFNPARESSVAEKLWEGPFIKPVEGRTSTTYGERRHVNGAPTSYRHSGMDIATPRGTPIMATNSGRVQLAMNLILTGNTIVIDHGLGIFSVYFHCDSLNVEEGQMVKKSDIIAEVGSTGFSTGPHLHWTMSIFDQNIEPAWVIGNEF